VRSVTCPDCGATVEIPVVTVGDESIVVYCKNCLWHDLDALYGARGLVVWGGGVTEMACWTCVGPGAGLQAAINTIPAGGILMLQSGTYTGDITISAPNVTIIGAGSQQTILTGSVSVTCTGNVVMRDLNVRASGKAYGVKLFRSGGGVTRCELTDLWIGASALNAGDGPVVGLWLDGAILNRFEHVTFGFNTGAGLYVNTTDLTGAFTTNENTFEDCTFSGNGTYGVQMEMGVDGAAGMMLNSFHGGNMENNTTGAFIADNCTGIVIDGVDFEVTTVANPNIISLTSCQPVEIKNCNFHVGGSGSATRFFAMFSCACGRVTGNRTDGFSAGDIGTFNENCVQCEAYDNVIWNDGSGRFINNRGSMRGNVA